jgi:hypothetical protein
VLQTLFEGGDLSEPPFVLGLDKALLGVLRHLVDAAKLGRIDAQKSASGAGVLVDAWRAVRPMTFAERDPAQQEMLFELGPLIGLGNPVFSDRTQLSPPFDERPVRGDQVFREDRGISAGGVEIEVAQQGGGDVQR